MFSIFFNVESEPKPNCSVKLTSLDTQSSPMCRQIYDPSPHRIRVRGRWVRVVVTLVAIATLCGHFLSP